MQIPPGSINGNLHCGRRSTFFNFSQAESCVHCPCHRRAQWIGPSDRAAVVPFLTPKGWLGRVPGFRPVLTGKVPWSNGPGTDVTGGDTECQLPEVAQVTGVAAANQNVPHSRIHNRIRGCPGRFAAKACEEAEDVFQPFP